MSYCKHCRRLSYYKHGEYMEPPCSVHPIAEWCILGIEVYCGTGQLSFLSPRGGKYIEIPRGVRNRHGVLSFGGTYMEVSFDADVAMEHGIRAAVVLNHIAHLMCGSPTGRRSVISSRAVALTCMYRPSTSGRCSPS